MKSKQTAWRMAKQMVIAGRWSFRRRILSFIALYLCICVLGVTAYADGCAESVLTNLLEYDGALTMQIVVSGHVEAAAGTPVVFYLTNETGEPSHYAQSVLDDEGAYRFGFLINPEYGDGTFTYEVKPKDLSAQTGTIEIVDVKDLTVLLEYIRAGVLSAEGLQAQISQINPAINLPFYNKISLSELSEVLYAELSAGNTPASEEELYQWIQQGVVVAGVNSCPGDLFRNGRFQYTDQIGLDTESAGLYATELSTAGLTAVQNGLEAADYSSAAECAQALRRLILTNCITHHVSGDLDEAVSNLLRYGTELGLDLSKAAGKEIQVARILANAGSTTPEELIEAYNTAVESSNTGGNGGSSSSSGGGGSGGGSGGYQPAVQPNDSAIQFGETVTVSGFADMADYSWADEAVASLRNRGIVNGKTETEFAPGDLVTREEFVKMVMEGFGLMPTNETDTTLETRFNDVDTAQWYAPYVIRAAGLGVVTGISEEEFGIGQQISRQDMATLAFRALRYQNSSLDTDLTDVTFTDTADIAEYAKTPTLLLKKLNILSGYPDGSFRPEQTANRAEAAQMMYRLLALQ